MKGKAEMDLAANAGSAPADTKGSKSPSPKTQPWNPSHDPEARNAPQPTLVLSNWIDEGTLNDDEDDLERTNPWNVAAVQELGLDDEELRKLGEPKPGDAGPPAGASKRRRGKFP
jgi:hypothetical protein